MDESRVRDSDESVIIAHNWDELRYALWGLVVSFVPTNAYSAPSIDRPVKTRSGELRQLHITDDLIELRNLLHVADLIVRSALQRRESQLHFN